MNYTYCHKQCQKGMKVSEELLSNNNSAYDAAFDFITFAKNCFKTCPFINEHMEESN